MVARRVSGSASKPVQEMTADEAGAAGDEKCAVSHYDFIEQGFLSVAQTFLSVRMELS